jgi:hypothetical protein
MNQARPIDVFVVPLAGGLRVSCDLSAATDDGGGKKLGQFGGISGTRHVVEQWKPPATVA